MLIYFDGKGLTLLVKSHKILSTQNVGFYKLGCFIEMYVNVIFSYSLSLIKALHDSNIFKNKLGVIFSDIKVFLSKLLMASLSQVSRNFNIVAHRLAKYAL